MLIKQNRMKPSASAVLFGTTMPMRCRILSSASVINLSTVQINTLIKDRFAFETQKRSTVA